MTVSVRDFTGGETAGSGLFDELMRTVNSHLRNEYDRGRIAGNDYGQVYLGSLNGAMQTASQFTLALEQTNKENELLTQQIAQIKTQNEILLLQKDQAVIAKDTAQYNLDFTLPEQLNKLLAETAATVQQTLLIQSQIGTQEKQQLQITAQTELTGKQENLVDEQILAATYQYTTPTAGLLFAQYTKVQKEIDILAQKKITEEAQTEDLSADTSPVGGLVGKEMNLKKVQADSFLRDAEQKAAKLYADAFQIMFSVNPEGETFATPDYWGMSQANSQAVFTTLQSGVTT